jgi:hypothetical protein
MFDLVSCRYVTNYALDNALIRLHAHTQSAATFSEEEDYRQYRQYRSVKSLVVMSVTICCLLILQSKPCWLCWNL